MTAAMPAHALHGARSCMASRLPPYLGLFFFSLRQSQELEDLDGRLAAIEAGDSGDYLDQVWKARG